MPLVQVFARFRFNVRRAQRILRQLFACSHARLEVLGRIFDDVAATEYEHRVAHMLAHLHTVCTLWRFPSCNCARL